MRGDWFNCRVARFSVWASVATVLLLLTSCTRWRKQKPNLSPPLPQFAEHYQALAQMPSQSHAASLPSPRVTISAAQMSLGEFARLMADQHQVSIVLEQTLDLTPVTVELADVPLDDALTAVGRRAGVDVSRAGKLYFFGQLKKQDRGLLVRRCRRLAGDELVKAVDALRSDLGQSVAFPDGLVVVSDRVEVLVRISELMDQIEAAESPCWVVQLHLIALSGDELQELGIEATPALEISAAFAQGSAAGLFQSMAAKSSLNAGLSALLKVARTSDRVSVVAEPFVLLVDGEHHETSRGNRIPIPKRTTSPQGTVTTTGFEYVQTGLTIVADLREQSAQAAKLKLSIEQSEVSGYVEGAPITVNEKFGTTAVLASGGVYLLGSMNRIEEQKSGNVGLSFAQRGRDQQRVLQVWARIQRVHGPALVGSEFAEVQQ